MVRLCREFEPTLCCRVCLHAVAPILQITLDTPLTFKPMTRANIRALILEEVAEYNGGASLVTPTPTSFFSFGW